MYEEQLEGYLHTFHIPEDYQERILDHHRKLEAAYDDAEKERAVLEGRLRRLKEMYEWGDYTRAAYETRKIDIVKQLDALTPTLGKTDHLDKLAQLLSDVPAAWEMATQEQRNKLARTVFDQVWVKDNVVVAVKPRPELEPFFRLNYEEFLEHIIEVSGSTLPRLHHEHEMPSASCPPGGGCSGLGLYVCRLWWSGTGDFANRRSFRLGRRLLWTRKLDGERGSCCQFAFHNHIPAVVFNY